MAGAHQREALRKAIGNFWGFRTYRGNSIDIARYVTTFLAMEIEFDPSKRGKTLAERGLDFLDAPRVFTGDRDTITLFDDRLDYGETRRITYGWLDDRAVVLVHVERDGVMRVISMRHAHQEEIDHVGLG